ncbi:transmembrane protein, putative (macronuclear) [Tetrahymena thermophila SB210]|uniref:Transmembrane protein, putative n=1 Tax=Tetrahymena thermophila (strain SB210) TaxID=312017 RepID=W7XCR5_TETTS|nr:transmembrane protein, putative [Tetrahymena thermophila SB210]EWS74333.1 transmembrane protein, putative [Tetrahymena thermophila SB210]|eukprot:XP_012653154.1 transmembrane protein, putative [Tetrahymena thermophila SB210]
MYLNEKYIELIVRKEEKGKLKIKQINQKILKMNEQRNEELKQLMFEVIEEDLTKKILIWKQQKQRINQDFVQCLMFVFIQIIYIIKYMNVCLFFCLFVLCRSININDYYLIFVLFFHSYNTGFKNM